MKNKKLLVFITIIVNILLILNSTAVFAVSDVSTLEIYSGTHLIISSIMKLIAVIILVLYIIFLIIYMIKSKEDNKKKIKKAIKWLIILIIVVVGLWFVSEKVPMIGIVEEYWSPIY